ncbi:hypothetical protein SAMN05421820_11452 [Pedobacter steynii]|uniref:Zinc-finger domain-containing protein n=1 Tax=Pedobacter steynii TaxID=430522 RepID=A0A1H0J263_9SPHI|nr:hypothetical protein [Pedobacter steynii]NQX43003.1 hypothetical protein [Pedobacter steynii]SDO37539.1 hypothetical protein SAMN05421820_11452 [Pedobacter steynii]
MDNNHLTDDIIQAYIEQEVADNNIALHISACAVCKAKLESYQILMRAMGNIEPETFSFDATALVMQKIEQSENKKITIGSYALTAFLAILILGVFVICIPLIRPVFQLFHAMIANALIVVSALSVFIFLLTAVFRQYKQKEMLLTA